MIVLAIDPGPTRSAWVLFDSEHQALINFGLDDNEKLLNVFKGMFLIHGGGQYLDEIAIEMIGHYGTGMPAGATVFDTCVWIGRFVQLFSGIKDAHLIKRGEVKQHLCHSARAKDPNIRQALIDRFGPPGTKKEPGKLYGVSKDVWAALGVAVTYADQKGGM